MVQEYLERGIPEETARPRVKAIVEAKNQVSLRSRLATPSAQSIWVDRDTSSWSNYHPVYHGYTPEQLVKKVLLSDSRAESAISNVSFRGTGWNGTAWSADNRSLHYFENGSMLGIERGLLLATGEALSAEGPNTATGEMSGGVSVGGDPELETICSDIYSGSILEFDFVPFTTKMTFDFIFVSEEYGDYSNKHDVNDAFGFFVWKTSDSANKRNIARFPNDSAVTISNSNWGYKDNESVHYTYDTTGYAAAAYYWPPPLGGIYLPDGSPIAVNPQWHTPNYTDGSLRMTYDGQTVKLSAVADNLVVGEEYHLKLAICNKGDNSWGSAIFLSNLDLGIPDAGIEPGEGFESDKYIWDKSYDLIAPNQWYTGCPQTLELKFVANAVERDVNLTYLGLANKYIVGTDGKPIPSKLTLAAGDTVISLDFKTLPVPSELEGGTGAILAAIDMGGSDTTDYFNFYNRPTYSVEYILPTTLYAGKLELNLKGGSPNLLRSINGGITWQNAWQPFTAKEISSIGLDGSVILREPHSCCDAIISFGKPEVSSPVVRTVKIPTIAGVDVYPAPGRHFVNSRSNLTVIVRPTGDKEGMIPVLSTNRTQIPDSVGVKLEEVRDGVYTFVIYYVQQELDIRIDFIPAPVDTAPVDETAVWGDRGLVGITSARAGEVKIYNISGIHVQTFILPSAGTSRIPLPPGVYIVSLNEKTYKTIVK
jgi:hypothetical protein